MSRAPNCVRTLYGWSVPGTGLAALGAWGFAAGYVALLALFYRWLARAFARAAAAPAA